MMQQLCDGVGLAAVAASFSLASFPLSRVPTHFYHHFVGSWVLPPSILLSILAPVGAPVGAPVSVLVPVPVLVLVLVSASAPVPVAVSSPASLERRRVLLPKLL